ncbi:hypothetical protein EE612_001453 [Oryza sativa]|nr:hypothetical protein EE612_001453 [Oryza sativa]
MGRVLHEGAPPCAPSAET